MAARASVTDSGRDPCTGWSLTTGYGRVLLCIAAEPRARLRDIAAATGLTERAVQAIVRRLVEDGALRRHREGRRNRYEIIEDFRLHHDDAATLGRWVRALAAASAPR